MQEAVKEIITLGVTYFASFLFPIASMKSLLLRRPLKTNLKMISKRAKITKNGLFYHLYELYL